MQMLSYGNENLSLKSIAINLELVPSYNRTSP